MYQTTVAATVTSQWEARLYGELGKNPGNNRRNFRKKANKYVLLDGTLHYIHPKTQKHLRVIRVTEKEAILQACHVAPTAGHQGVNKTTSLIMSRYFWPGPQYNDIANFIASCDECQRSNHLRKVPAVLHPITPPDTSFTQFGMDLVGPLTPSASGNRYITVMTDYLTKWPEAEAIPNKEAGTIAKVLMKLVCRYSNFHAMRIKPYLMAKRRLSSHSSPESAGSASPPSTPPPPPSAAASPSPSPSAPESPGSTSPPSTPPPPSAAASPSPSPSADCTETGFTPAPPLIFNPVDTQWQSDRAKILGFRVRKKIRPSPAEQTISHEEEPLNTIAMRGDGNCFFRTISYFLTGAQTNHRVLRAITVQYMKENNTTFNNFAEQDNYADVSNMAQTGEYATEVEILAVASLLATPIWTYSPFGEEHR